MRVSSVLPCHQPSIHVPSGCAILPTSYKNSCVAWCCPLPPLPPPLPSAQFLGGTPACLGILPPKTMLGPKLEFLENSWMLLEDAHTYTSAEHYLCTTLQVKFMHKDSYPSHSYLRIMHTLLGHQPHAYYHLRTATVTATVPLVILAIFCTAD